MPRTPAHSQIANRRHVSAPISLSLAPHRRGRHGGLKPTLGFRLSNFLRLSDFGLRISLLLFAPFAALGADNLVHAKDGSGIYGYNDTPKLPWCAYRVHDPDRPVPPRVDPGPTPVFSAPPPDALVLFDGKDLAQWQKNNWRVVDGCLETVGASNLTTTNSFGDCQLHLEWLAPANFQGALFDQGNNGVMLMGRFEIQIFESFNEKIYPDGQAAAVYGQTPPLVNACRKPGQWQSYDIAFTAPRFDGDRLVQPARVTVFHNGLLVQNNQEIYGATGHRILPQYSNKTNSGPLLLAGHHCPVRFRNLWLRRL